MISFFIFAGICFVWFSITRAQDCWDKATYKDRIHDKYKYEPYNKHYENDYFIWNWQKKRDAEKERFKNEFQDFDLDQFFKD